MPEVVIKNLPFMLQGLLTSLQISAMVAAERFLPSFFGTTQKPHFSRQPRWVKPMEASKAG